MYEHCENCLEYTQTNARFIWVVSPQDNMIIYAAPDDVCNWHCHSKAVLTQEEFECFFAFTGAFGVIETKLLSCS